MGTAFILILLICPSPRTQHDQVFRQVFWLPDLFTCHAFPLKQINLTVVNVTFIPGYSGGSAPDFNRIPF